MEFIINQFLSLKLENDITMIYVGEEPFHQCKFLLLEIPVRDITALDEVKSIDEAAQELGHSLEPSDESSRFDRIPPETEFWGHCSNLQAWYENNYNTKLLHSNLAFPLLKKLTEMGDLLARKVFKDEIANRYNSGIETVRKFLEKGNYLGFLTKEEFYSLIDTNTEYGAVKTLESTLAIDRYALDIRNGQIIELHLSNLKLKELPEILKKLKGLEILSVSNNFLKALPNWIGEFKNLRLLNVSSNKLKKLPFSIGNLRLLEKLVAFNNDLTELPDSIGNLSFLKVLDFRWNELNCLPTNLDNLTKMDELNLESNNIEVFPESIGELRSLKTLALAKNSISIIPKTIEKLNFLETLTFGNNNLEEISDSVGNLKNLKILGLNNNSIKSLPYSFENLVSLRRLSLVGNPIGFIPEFLFKLPNLVMLFIKDTNIRKSQNLKKKLKEKNIDIGY